MIRAYWRQNIDPISSAIVRRFTRLRDAFRLHLSFHDIQIRVGELRQPDELIVFCLVKNGSYYLKTFIDYYLAKGVDHIVLIDNGSTDETLSIAARYSQVTVVQSSLSARKYERQLRLHAVNRFGCGGWCLVVDVDELFDYPNSDLLPLRGLLQYLDRSGYDTLICQMLDMYSCLPLGAGPSADEDFLTSHVYFDTNDIERREYSSFLDSFLRENKVSNPLIQLYFGGVRKRLFGTNNFLTKHPLFRFREGLMPLTHVHCCSHARCADVTGVLKHYKLAGDFVDRTKRQVFARIWSHGEDEKYLKAMKSGRLLEPMAPYTRRLESANQLVEIGFLVDSVAYRSFAQEPRGRG